jgi:putative colanic acid biosynthesis acetyltransferase WcaB
MGFLKFIQQDFSVNKGNTKGKIIALHFRMASYCYNSKLLSILFLPYLLFYKYFVQIIFSLELPYGLSIGKGFKIYHGNALVIHQNTLIGNNCVIRQSTTIGNAVADGKCPVIGNNVNIGCNVCIIGDVIIGDNVAIGAGSVIVKNIPSNSVVVGNPGRVIKVLPPLQV